jgi:hypothetical protein
MVRIHDVLARYGKNGKNRAELMDYAVSSAKRLLGRTSGPIEGWKITA